MRAGANGWGGRPEEIHIACGDTNPCELGIWVGHPVHAWKTCEAGTPIVGTTYCGHYNILWAL